MKASAIQDQNGKAFLRLQREDKGDIIEIRSNNPMPSGNILIVNQNEPFSHIECPPYTVLLVPFFANLSISIFRHYTETRKIPYEKLLKYIIQSYKNCMVVFLLDDDRYNQLTVDFVDFLQNELKVSIEVVVYVFHLNTNRRVYMELMKRRCRCITSRMKTRLNVSNLEQKVPENIFHFKPVLETKFMQDSIPTVIEKTEKEANAIPGLCGMVCKNIMAIHQKNPQKKIKEEQEEAWPAIQESVLKKTPKKFPALQEDTILYVEKESPLYSQRTNESTYILRDAIQKKESEKTLTLFDEMNESSKDKNYIIQEETSVLPLEDGYKLTQDFPDLEAILLLDNLGFVWRGIISLLRASCPEIALPEILETSIRMLKTEIYYREAASFYETTLDRLTDQILEIAYDPRRARNGFIVRTDYVEWLQYPSRISDILFRLVAIVLLKIQTQIKTEVRNFIANQILSLLDEHLQYYMLPCTHNPKRQCQSKKLFQYFRNFPLPKGEKEMLQFCCSMGNEKDDTQILPLKDPRRK